MGVTYLCLNTLRTFRKKKLQLLMIGTIIFLSSFLYTAMFYSMDSLEVGVMKLVEETNQEDFVIEIIDGLMVDEMRYVPLDKQMLYSTYSLTELKQVDYGLYEGILEARARAFLERYPNYQIELRSYKEIDFRYNDEAHKVRFYKPGEVINKNYIERGREPALQNEVALNKVYTDANGLKIGDTVTIDERTYTLTGNLLLSDMNLPMFDETFTIDPRRLTIGTLSPKGYERLQGVESIYFAGKHVEEHTKDTFRQDVIDTVADEGKLDFVLGIIETKNQVRSGAIYEELKMGKSALLGLCLIISSLAVMIVGILVAKLLKKEKGQIGVLKALGYTPYEIATPYIVLLLIIAVPTLMIGYIAGVFCAQPMKEIFLAFYLLPNEPIIMNQQVIVIAILVPLSFILGLSFVLIKSLLSKRTLELLKAGEEEKVTYLTKAMSYLLRHTKVTTKFKYTFMMRNTSKVMLFVWGIMFSAMMILLSFSMIDFFDKLTVEHFESTAYVYDGILDPTKPKPRQTGEEERYLTIGGALYAGDQITLKGMDQPNNLHQLYNREGDALTYLLDEGVLVNQSFVITYGVKENDIITLTYQDREYPQVIKGITKDYGDQTVYMTRENLSLIATEGRSKKMYNGVYSMNPLSESQYLMVINKPDMMAQTETMQGFVKIGVGGMMGSAIGIAVMILYLLTTMTVEDNYYNISLLKVLGYSEREVSNMILKSYLTYAMITYGVAVPITHYGMKWMVWYFSYAFDMVMPLELEWFHVLLGGMVIFVIFNLGVFAAKKQISSVSLQEILKAYRE